METNGESNGRLPTGPTSRGDPAPAPDPFRPLAFAALTLALIGLCVAVAVPLLPALTWAAALAVIAYPLHTCLARRTGRPGVAAFVTTAAVAVVVVTAAMMVTVQLAREAANAAESGQQKPAGDAVREAMAGNPWLSGVVAWMDRVGVDLNHQIRSLIEAYTGNPAGLAQGSLVGLVQAALAGFILFYLLRDRAELLEGIRGVLPMTRAECDRVFARFADSVHANLYADLVTSLIDGVAGGLVFWLVGVPSPILWGMVMFVVSLLPLFGAWVVWLPAAAYLALTGAWGGVAVLIGYGLVSWFVVDNVIYVRIAGDRMRLHEVPTLVAFLGGLAVFGTSGMVLGPAIMAVTVAVLDVWRARRVATETGRVGPAERVRVGAV